MNLTQARPLLPSAQPLPLAIQQPPIPGNGALPIPTTIHKPSYSNTINGQSQNKDHQRSLLFGKVDPNTPIYSRTQMLDILKSICIDFDEPSLKEQHTAPTQGAPPHQIVIELNAPRPTAEELYQQQLQTGQITDSTNISNLNAMLQTQALAPWSLALEWRRQHNLEKTKRFREQQQQQQQQQGGGLPQPQPPPSLLPTTAIAPIPTPASVLPTPNALPLPLMTPQGSGLGALPMPQPILPTPAPAVGPLGALPTPVTFDAQQLSPMERENNAFIQPQNNFFGQPGLPNPAVPQMFDPHQQHPQPSQQQHPGFFPGHPQHMAMGMPPMMMHALFIFDMLNNFQDPTQPIWFYTDQYRCEQGPFSSNDMSQWYYQGYITDNLSIRFAGQPAPNLPPIETPPFPLVHWFAHGRSAFLHQIPEQYQAQAQHALAMQKQFQAAQQQQQQQQPQHFFDPNMNNGQFQPQFNSMGGAMFPPPGHVQDPMAQQSPLSQPASFLQAVGGVQGQSPMQFGTPMHHHGGFITPEMQNGFYMHAGGDDDDDDVDGENGDDLDEEYVDPFNDTLGYIPDDDYDPAYRGAELAYTASFHRANQDPTQIQGFANQFKVPFLGQDQFLNPQSPTEDVDEEEEEEDVVQQPKQQQQAQPEVVVANTTPKETTDSLPVKSAWGILPQASVKSFNEVQKEQANEERVKQQQKLQEQNASDAQIAAKSAQIVEKSAETYVEHLQPVSRDADQGNNVQNNTEKEQKSFYVERLTAVDHQVEKFELDKPSTVITAASATLTKAPSAAPTQPNLLDNKSGWGAIPTTLATLPSGPKKMEKSTANVAPASTSTGWAKAVASTPATVIVSQSTPAPITIVSNKAAPSTSLLGGATLSAKATAALKPTTTNAWAKPVVIPTTPSKSHHDKEPLDVFETPQKLPSNNTFSTPAPLRTNPSVTAPVAAPAEPTPAPQPAAPKPMSADFKKWFSGELKKLVGTTDVSTFEWIWDVQDNNLCREMLLDAFGDRAFALDFIKHREQDQKQSSNSETKALQPQPQQKKQQSWTTVDEGRAIKVEPPKATGKKQQQNAALSNNTFAALTTQTKSSSNKKKK